jgi:hypothetical protein
LNKAARKQAQLFLGTTNTNVSPLRHAPLPVFATAIRREIDNREYHVEREFGAARDAYRSNELMMEEEPEHSDEMPASRSNELMQEEADDPFVYVPTTKNSDPSSVDFKATDEDMSP